MWWEPTWLVSGYKMKRVQLDAAGEACKLARTAGIKTHESLNCPGNKVQIVKIAWPGLKDKWPTAYKFFKAYQITNEQQGPMGMAVAAEGKKASDVAKKWVDANEAVWKPWVDKATH